MTKEYWIQTASGKRYYYDSTEDDPQDFYLSDMARGVSRLCRYAGQMKDVPELEDEIYSVAQHSVYVYRMLRDRPDVPRRVLPWALLHDALEGFYVDLPSPLKALVPSYGVLEHTAEKSFTSFYGIPFDDEVKRWVKYADYQVLYAESEEFCAIPSSMWDVPATPAKTLREIDPDFFYWRPKHAYNQYMSSYQEVLPYLMEV